MDKCPVFCYNVPNYAKCSQKVAHRRNLVAIAQKLSLIPKEDMTQPKKYGDCLRAIYTENNSVL